MACTVVHLGQQTGAGGFTIPSTPNACAPPCDISAFCAFSFKPFLQRSEQERFVFLEQDLHSLSGLSSSAREPANDKK